MSDQENTSISPDDDVEGHRKMSIQDEAADVEGHSSRWHVDGPEAEDVEGHKRNGLEADEDDVEGHARVRADAPAADDVEAHRLHGI